MSDFFLYLIIIALASIFIGMFIRILFLCIRLPIIIAKNRNLTGTELKTISILSWFSLLNGVTWIIALLLSIIYKPKNCIDKDKGLSLTDLEKLEKLKDLREKGIFTAEEFEREKANILNK